MSDEQTPATLPFWLQLLYLAVDQMPSTNMKVVFAMVLTVLTGAYLALAGVVAALGHLHVPVNVDVLDSWLMFVGAWATLAGVAYVAKRATYNKQDSSNAKP